MTQMQEIMKIAEELGYEAVSQKCIISCAKMISSVYNGSRDKIVEALADVEIAAAGMTVLLRCDNQKTMIRQAKLERETEHAADRS